jgi:hypothetical protein
MSTLSPAAQVVLDAFWKQRGDRSALAAALRAAVNQVVPPVDEAAIGRVQNRIGTIYTCGNQDARRRIRAEFLAIAAELDGGTNNTSQEDYRNG